MNLKPGASTASAQRVLSPEERVSEVLFGLIMVITFTGSLSIAEAGRDDVRTMVIGAVGCNVAWGIIDSVFYLLGCLAERSRSVLTLRALRGAPDSAAAQQIIVEVLPPLVASVLEPSELESIQQRLRTLPQRDSAGLTKSDAAGALGVFLLVFVTTFPVTIPFIFVHDISVAMRFSNAIALSMLLVAGAVYGRSIGRSALAFSVGMAGLGGVLVALTIALGG
jgi:hypothetical protein